MLSGVFGLFADFMADVRLGLNYVARLVVLENSEGKRNLLIAAQTVPHIAWCF